MKLLWVAVPVVFILVVVTLAPHVPFRWNAVATPDDTSSPIATLSYGIFQGRYSTQLNITYFRKIPFAAPPIGVNRFRGPQPPLSIEAGVYDSDQDHDICTQTAAGIGSEDCLYLGLYSRPWSTGQPLRPVLVNFHGGGYIGGGASSTLPPLTWSALNVSSNNDYVTINPQYRLNAFGWLPGKTIAEDPESDLNPGLLDQHAVLKWVQEHISAFGGDPGNVTIWGQSAGGGSVVAHAIADPKLQSGLITRALASSPFWPHCYRYDSPEAEDIYSTFATLAGCAGPESLRCLKAADAQTLLAAAITVQESHRYTSSFFTWGPVIDDVYLTTPLSKAEGNIRANLPGGAFTTYNTHEGEDFVPFGKLDVGPSLNTSDISLDGWLDGFLPYLTSKQRRDLLNIYPPTGSAESIPAYDSLLVRAGLIYRDLTIACPAYWLASTFSSTSGTAGHGYLGQYTIQPATHGEDLQLFMFKVGDVLGTFPETYNALLGAFASWFVRGDPNEGREMTSAEQDGVPKIENGEWVVGLGNFSSIRVPQLARRCDFWRAAGADANV